jgi:hypothetical protein
MPVILQWLAILLGVRSDHEDPSAAAMCFAHFTHELPCTACAARNAPSPRSLHCLLGIGAPARLQP